MTHALLDALAGAALVAVIATAAVIGVWVGGAL